MNSINNLRDRLLLRLLSRPTRTDLARIVFNDLPSEISHYICGGDPDHIAPSLTFGTGSQAPPFRAAFPQSLVQHSLKKTATI